MLSTLVDRGEPGARVALPVAASRAAERDLPRRSGAKIVWTKLSASHLMEVARSEEVDLAASQSGGFICPRFLPPSTGRRPWSTCWPCSPPPAPLSDLVAALPPVHMVHEPVHTPWELKGMVMRTLVERPQGSELVLVDGVKILEPDGWALVLPDPESP